MNENESENKFLVFSVGEELYASPLLSIREVLEFQPPKPMPNMVHYFTGVINVRGAIVGVIDLRTKFGHEAKNWPCGFGFVFFENSEMDTLTMCLTSVPCGTSHFSACALK